MRIEYRRQFSKDLKKLRKQPVYEQLHNLAFEILPDAKVPSRCTECKGDGGCS